ncbi:MAG TPA: sugar ABC transporter ATP-binding protein [Bacillota bacterium]|nr:sugar ABC transporter ATP-binding protein [Bacillota bacterium]
MSESAVLELIGITKDYYGVTVLKGIDLKVKPGEIHGIIGENGAGKSTLMNILFGMSVIHETGGFQGEIRIDGEPVVIDSPARAMELGIGMVHQEFMLLPGFSIAENIKLNREITCSNVISRVMGKSMETLDFKAMRQDARSALDHLSINIDETLPVAGLPVGYMQFVEIAREIDKKNLRVMVFDEPSAVLTESEAGLLLEAMRRLSEKGIAILFITHRLDEVMAVAHSISILRDGQLVARMERDQARIDKIAEWMVGRKVERSVLAKRPVAEDEAEDVILEIHDLSVEMPGEVVHRFDLKLRRGEILGIGGLAGHGKIGVANGIMGLYPARGSVFKDGLPVSLNNPRQALLSGMAMVSEDRRRVGLWMDESIEMNISFTAMQVQGKFLWPGPLERLRREDRTAMREHALTMIKDLDIRCTGPQQIVRHLSGGNQQKVCLARALTMKPDILWASEPTRGIDIGAKQLILDYLVRCSREGGMTIVMTSSELEELRRICDRIVIMYEGRISGILPPDASDMEFGMMMAGKYQSGKGVGIDGMA